MMPVVATEVLEHIPADIQAIQELALWAPGDIAVSVPRWFPEIVNWKLSEDYHNIPGGHIRIYSDKELIGKLANAGLEFQGSLRPRPALAVLVDQVRRGRDATTTTRSPRPTTKLLVWEIMKQPRALRWPAGCWTR